ncbi:MAG: SIS domain-containing protein [archaeon]
MTIETQFDELIKAIKDNYNLKDSIQQAADMIINSIEQGGKILICGNGGSAADSQHIAAELVGKYEKKRKALPAIALTTDSSILTALSNDDNFLNVFSKQVEGLGKEGDVLMCITTSGNSENLIRAIKQAKKQGLKTIGFNGNTGGPMKGLTDVEVFVKHNRTSRIQEVQHLAYHIICGIIEDHFS